MGPLLIWLVKPGLRKLGLAGQEWFSLLDAMGDVYFAKIIRFPSLSIGENGNVTTSIGRLRVKIYQKFARVLLPRNALIEYQNECRIKYRH
jgi:hypothetical protein